jgi:RNA polymerase sigma factor (sigma-70 family)
MESTVVPDRTTSESLTDEEVARRVRGGETALYEIVMRRYNQRLYRVARAILHNDAEAEDVMQDTYVRAYEHLDQFAGRAPFSAWLTRIAVHEALARLRLRNRTQSIDDPERDGELSVIMTSKSPVQSRMPPDCSSESFWKKPCSAFPNTIAWSSCCAILKSSAPPKPPRPSNFPKITSRCGCIGDTGWCGAGSSIALVREQKRPFPLWAFVATAS